MASANTGQGVQQGRGAALLDPGARGGASPHARGPLHEHPGSDAVDGNIPARAGTTSPRSRRARSRREHPRMRGDHKVPADRGIVPRAHRPFQHDQFPAHAGGSGLDADGGHGAGSLNRLVLLPGGCGGGRLSGHVHPAVSAACLRPPPRAAFHAASHPCGPHQLDELMLRGHRAKPRPSIAPLHRKNSVVLGCRRGALIVAKCTRVAPTRHHLGLIEETRGVRAVQCARSEVLQSVNSITYVALWTRARAMGRRGST